MAALRLLPCFCFFAAGAGALCGWGLLLGPLAGVACVSFPGVDAKLAGTVLMPSCVTPPSFDLGLLLRVETLRSDAILAIISPASAACRFLSFGAVACLFGACDFHICVVPKLLKVASSRLLASSSC